MLYLLFLLIIPWKDLTSMSKLSQMSYGYKKFCQPTTYYADSEECTLKQQKITDISELSPQGNVIKFIENEKDLECIIHKNVKKKRYTIIFRGTESAEDWRNNLNVLKVSLDKRVTVHNGFLKQLTNNESYDKIKETVESSRNNNYDWWLTGHSAGGGLAILCSYLLSKEYPDKSFTVVSIASPKVGGKGFSQEFKQMKNLKCWRVIYDKDIVPLLPPMGYSHVGKLITLSSNEGKKLRLRNIVTDHHINNYVAALTKLSNPRAKFF